MESRVRVGRSAPTLTGERWGCTTPQPDIGTRVWTAGMIELTARRPNGDRPGYRVLEEVTLKNFIEVESKISVYYVHVQTMYPSKEVAVKIYSSSYLPFQVQRMNEKRQRECNQGTRFKDKRVRQSQD